MSQPTQPSDKYASFTWPRLIAIGKIVIDCRTHVAELAEPERGDDKCGLGYRAWSQTKHSIVTHAATDYFDWLSIGDDGPVFIFKLGGMPIRFCKGDSEEPLPENYATATPLERAQIELALQASGRSAVEGFFRLLIASDGRGFPRGVWLAHCNLDGAIVMSWRIPEPNEGTGTLPIVVPQTPVTLPPLEILTEAEAAEREKARKALEAEIQKHKGA